MSTCGTCKHARAAADGNAAARDCWRFPPTVTVVLIPEQPKISVNGQPQQIAFRPQPFQARPTMEIADTCGEFTAVD